MKNENFEIIKFNNVIEKEIQIKTDLRGSVRMAMDLVDSATDTYTFITYSKKGVIRGLHFEKNLQLKRSYQVLFGKIYDVLVNIDINSKYFKKWSGRYIDSEENIKINVPEGYAHGYMCISESAVVLNSTNVLYNNETKGVLKWDDKELNINWPELNEYPVMIDPILSQEDMRGMSISEVEDMMKKISRKPRVV